MTTKRTTKKAPDKRRGKDGKQGVSRKKITAEDARLGWINGGWIDERIPNDEVEHAIVQNQLSIDSCAFLPWLAGRVGTYRMWQDASDSVPTPADELNHVIRLIEDIKSVETRISNLPPAADAEATYAALKAYGELFGALPRRLSEDLHRMRAVLSHAADRIEPYTKSKGGRKRAIHRDELLAAVSEKLAVMSGASVSESRQCAADVLRACGVPVPEDGRTRAGKGRAGKTGKK